MKTSQEWWNEVRRSEPLLLDWLKKQYHGEFQAWRRILNFIETNKKNTSWNGTLEKIAEQEYKHALWVGKLLENRGIDAEVLDKQHRYWEQTLASGQDFRTLTAVATHAERMRLERITVIANDVSAPTDIRTTFQKILVDEKFHAAAFEAMTTPEALEQTREAHLRGVKSIGLITQDMV
jgi:rubrerythrin